MAPENSQATGRVVEVHVSDLVGQALDWAVAKAIGGYRGEYKISEDGDPWPAWVFPGGIPFKATTGKFTPSNDWAQGGPLIEANQVSLHCPQTTDDVWAAWIITNKGEVVQAGDTALIAACRAIVSALLGEVVSVPAELVENKSIG